MHARLSLVAASCFVATILAAQSVSTQREPQRPTFTGQVESVRVDVYALSDAQPVKDLRRDEIALFEDGVPQTIQTFERIAFAAHDAASPVIPVRSLEESRRVAADARTRLFVVFLETRDAGFALGPRVQTQFPLVDMLNGLLGPDDLIAVMTPYMRAQDLTFTRRLPEIDDRWFPDPNVDPKHLLWDACFPPSPADDTNRRMKARDAERRIFDGIEALATHLGALREERSHVLIVSKGWLQYTEDESLLARRTPRGPEPPIGGRGRQPVGVISSQGTVTMTEQVWRECETDLQALAQLDHRNRIRELVTAANRNNVSFHPISPAGLDASTRAGTTGSGRGPFVNSTPLMLQGVLRDLGDSTGGLSIVNTNAVEPNLTRLVASTSAYYLLGYTPSNATLDGRYRPITVRVSRPGIHVHARPGYVAAQRATVTAAVAAPVASLVDHALAELEALVRAEGRVARDDGAAFFRAGSAPRAPFTATADPRFRRVERLRLEVLAHDAVRAAARLLDRRGEPRSVPLTITERRDDTTGSRWTVLDVTLTPLAIGDYVVEIRQGTTTRYAAFRIVR